MNTIDIRRFVDINIQPHITSQVSGTRDTLVIFTALGTAGNISGHPATTITDAEKLVSYQQCLEVYTDVLMQPLLSALKIYFDNGGAKVVVIEGVALTDFTSDKVKALANEFVMVGYIWNEENMQAVYTKLKDIATARQSDTDIYGVNEKILFANAGTYEDTNVIKNFAVKKGTALGSELTMAAYVSQINVYKDMTVNDYAFTPETLAEESIDTPTYDKCIANNINTDVYLANAVRNVGGNLKDGSDFVNGFVRIILHQTLSERLLNLLATKLKNVDGIGKVYAALTKELESYRQCGYLTTDKIWTDETLKVTVEGVEYTIIEQGTPLIDGYYVKVLPLTALTEEAKRKRKTPPIYVIIADQYGIRSVTVNGEII